MEEGRFRLDDFELYRAAREFRKKVYKLIKMLPPAEHGCLDKQMRRAAVSLTNNIAEGHARWHFRENVRLCLVARGSLGEILDDLNVCLDEGYGDAQAVTCLKEEAYGLMPRINGYIAYLRKRVSDRDSA
jgi:four helix bundle protein